MSDYIPMKNKSILSFDILPNEILFLIFDYLTSNDIIYSFINCNQRLQNLLFTQIYHFKIPTTNLNFWNKILPIIGSQIQTLIINIDYLTIPLDLFSNLSSIIISSPYSLLDGQLIFILNHPCFQQLHTFKIKDEILSKQLYDLDELNDEQILFKIIFKDKNNLQIFEYFPSLRWSTYRKFDKLNLNIHIRSLTLNLTNFNDIFILIQHTPNLIYLNVHSEMPYYRSEKFKSTNINSIKLEKFYLKFKLETMYEDMDEFSRIDYNQIFCAIHLFSSSLITLSLNFVDINAMNSNCVLLNGIKLENDLLKPMKKLRNFCFYACIYRCKNIQEILSTFKTFPWSIGIHENAYLYSLPFPFHKLKRFHSFRYVLSNNDEILKYHHRLWSNVTSLELVYIDKIYFKTLFSSIKLNMPKLSSITFFDVDHYHCVFRFDFNEIKRINVELDSVTTVHLKQISMRKVQQILMYSFPNLQRLKLDWEELISQDNQLTSFLGRQIQRIEMYESFPSKSPIQETDFSYLLNVQHIKLRYGYEYSKELLNSRSRMVSNLLTKLPKLERLSIYAILCDVRYDGYDAKDIFRQIMDGLDENEIKAHYEIKYVGKYMWFIKTIVSSCF